MPWCTWQYFKNTETFIALDISIIVSVSFSKSSCIGQIPLKLQASEAKCPYFDTGTNTSNISATIGSIKWVLDLLASQKYP